MKTVIAAEPWRVEPSLIPLPWRDAVNFFPDNKIKVAVMWHDEVVRPHPPVQRALENTVNILRALPNIELVDWKPYRHAEAWEIISSLYYADGGAYETEEFGKSGEPWRPLTRFIITDNPNVKRL